MKEFVVFYTLDDDIKRERILKEADASKEQVLLEIVKRMEQRQYFLAKGDQGEYWINCSSVRYIGVHEKNNPNFTH